MYFRRWRRRIDFHFGAVIMPVFIAITLASIFISQLNARLRPILFELAISQTSNSITAAISDAVTEQAIAYSDLITLERSTDGDIVALTSNMARANLLRSQLLEISLETLRGLESVEFKIPLGTIYDWELFSGRGPNIGVRVLYTGTSSAEFQNSFSSAGINQTCHQVIFHIQADVFVFLSGKQEKTTVDTKICIAETIIVGKVPETYLELKP